MAATLCPWRYFGMLLISNINPKIGSRFTSMKMLVVKSYFLKKLFFLIKTCFLPCFVWISKNLKNTSKLYWFFGTRRPKKILILFSNLVEKKSQNFNFVKNWKVTILLGKDGFKLHNMAADKKNSGRMSRIVWVTRFFLCGRIFFCPPPYYAVWLNHS